MFEIGSTLRDARVRRDISLQQAEDETKIRVKYIQAMENEDFDILPGGTYVKGFLRTYAEYLGLDYQLILDEYNDRYGSGEHREHLIQPVRSANLEAEAPRSHGSQKNRNYIFVAVLAVAIIALLAYLGWGNNSSSDNGPAFITTTASSTAATGAATTAPPAQTQTQPPVITQPQTIQSIVISSTSQDNWVGVYKSESSGSGSLIWGDTLAPGDSKTLTSADLGSLQKVWIRTGSVSGLKITVNNQPQTLSKQAGLTYVVTPAGITGQ